MPLVGTRGALSSRGLGMLNLGGGYWLATLGAAINDAGRSIAVDVFDNCYVTGYTNNSGAGDTDILIAKYNTSGIIQWQKVLGGANADVGYGIAVDSSGNCYVTGDTGTSGAKNIVTTKYNSNGVIQWQRVLSGANDESGRGIAVDTSGNCYITGYTESVGAGGGDIFIAKYDTSGTIQWQRVLGGSNFDQGNAIAVDSSGNCYVTGFADASAGVGDVFIAKYNTSGAIQWQRKLSTATSDFGNGIAVDASGNCYIAGSVSISGNTEMFIAKYNTSGIIQWQRVLSGSGADSGNGIAVDSVANCYIVGTRNSDDILFAKYDTSGVIQWQRALGGTGSDFGRGAAVDVSGNIYFAGGTSSSGAGIDDVFIGKLPGNGAKTGTYGAFTYAVTSLTDSAGTLTDSAGTLTDATASLTDSAGSLVDATATLTSTVRPL